MKYTSEENNKGILGGTNAVTGNEAQFRAMLEEDVASGLLGVDAHTVVGDDGARLRGHLELREERGEW